MMYKNNELLDELVEALKQTMQALADSYGLEFSECVGAAFEPGREVLKKVEVVRRQKIDRAAQ